MDNDPIKIIVAKAVIVIGAGTIFGLGFMNLLFVTFSTDVIHGLIKPWFNQKD